MDSAADWKRYYAAERERLGRTALLDAVEAADPLAVDQGGAVVIPHTRLEVTAPQIAAAVATVLASGAERVLAIGVLHHARRRDQRLVQSARDGDADARRELRGVHTEDGFAAEEFSLDGFVEMLALAAEREGRHIDVTRRYPYLVGDDPHSLPGLDELHDIADGGAMVVVTTDPIHHGRAYGTPPSECRDAGEPETVAAARAAIDEQFRALAEHAFAEFAALTDRHNSDFRDSGPVMASLLGPGFDTVVHRLDLVDYAEPLEAAAPSWVAGALASVVPASD